MKLFCSLFWYRNFYCSPKTLWWNIKLFLHTYFNYIEVKLLSRFSLFFLFFKVTPFSRVANQNRGIFVGSMVQHFKQVRIHQTRIRNSGFFLPKSYGGANENGRGAKLLKLHCHIKLTQRKIQGCGSGSKCLRKKMDPDEDTKIRAERSFRSEFKRRLQMHLFWKMWIRIRNHIAT